MKLPDPPASIFISFSLSELPHVRMLQIVLEERGYRTYVNDLIAFGTNTEESYEIAHAVLISEISNSDVILNLRSNSLIKDVQAQTHNALEESFRKQNDHLIFFYMDIDPRVELDYDEQKSEVERSLDNLLEGTDLSFTDTQRAIGTVDQKIIDEARTVYKDLGNSKVDEEHVLKQLRITRGVFDDAIFYVDTKRHIFHVPILGSLNRKIIKNEHIALYNEALLKFHPYPPYIKRGNVFLSHASKDLPLVRQLQYNIEMRGIRAHALRFVTFEDMDDSSQVLDQVRAILELIIGEISAANATQVILLRSASFDRSAWTFIEQYIALEYGCPMIEMDIENHSIADLLNQYDAGEFADVTDEIRDRIKGSFPKEDFLVLAEVIGLLMLKRDLTPSYTDHLQHRVWFTQGQLVEAANFLFLNDKITQDEYQDFKDASK